MPHHPSKAHSVEIIDRRLQQAEAATPPDLMELLSLADELFRVERKWLDKAATPPTALPPNPSTGIAPKPTPRKAPRPPANPDLINARFTRVTNLLTAATRTLDPATLPPAVANLLRQTQQTLRERKALPGG